MEFNDYGEAWDYLRLLISGVSQVSTVLNIDKLLDTMYNIENKVKTNDDL